MNRRSKRLLRLAAAAAFAAVAGCSDADKADTGGVLLEISSFGTLPVAFSLNNPDPGLGALMQIDSIVLSNIAVNPAAGTSDLMTIRLESYEVTYTRRDGGTRVPRPLSNSIFGQVPINGTNEIAGAPMLATDQLLSNPLVDLSNDGVDSETGSSVIVMDINLRFFGETLGGTNVASNVESFTVQFLP